MEKNANKALLLRVATVALALVIAFAIGFVRGRTSGEPVEPSPQPTIEQQDNVDKSGEKVEPTSEPAPATNPEPESNPASDPGPATESKPYQLVFYPSQTGVDEDDVFVYGEPVGVPEGTTVRRGESYTSMEEVALYIHTYGTVPPNFVSKTKARNAGWVAEEGNLQDVLPGMSIGGGGWHNDDQVMPGDEWDQWYECDINYSGGYRGAERLVYSDNGMVFYTADHYDSYARIY